MLVLIPISHIAYASLHKKPFSYDDPHNLSYHIISNYHYRNSIHDNDTIFLHKNLLDSEILTYFLSRINKSQIINSISQTNKIQFTATQIQFHRKTQYIHKYIYIYNFDDKFSIFELPFFFFFFFFYEFLSFLFFFKGLVTLQIKAR